MPKYSGKSDIPSMELTERIQKIKYANRVRDEADKKYGYSRAVKEFNGDYKSALPDWMLGIDMIPINEVYAFHKTFIPSVYSRDPYITVNPKGRKWIIGAKILEFAINAYWRELKIKRQVKRAIKDAIDAEGYIKIGYSSSLGDVSKGEGDMAVNASEFFQEDEIFCQHIPWKMMVRDPDAIDGLYDARFIAQKLILPLDAVKESDLYENTSDLKPSLVTDINVPDDAKSGKEYRIFKNYVVLWEEWDRDEECVYTYAENHDKYLMKKDWPYQFKKKGSNQPYPYEMLRFNESTNEPYAPNLIGSWEPQLWEKMKIRALELDHIKRFGRQYIMEVGAMNDQEVDKMEKGITGSVVKKEMGKPDPTVLQYPPIQTDIYGVENRVDMDKDNISGQPSAVRAAPQKTQSRTVGEIKSIIGAFENRQNEPQDIVENYSEQISTKLIALMQQYFRGEKFIRVSQLDIDWLQTEVQLNQKKNPQDQQAQDVSQRLDPMGFLMKSKDIKDIDFEVEVRAGSALPLDKKNRIMAMTELIKLEQGIGIQPGSKLSKIIGKNLLSDFDMPEILSAYEDDLKVMDAQAKTQANAAMMKHQLDGDRLKQIQARAQHLKQRGVPMGVNGGQTPTPPQVPPELLG